MIHRFWHGLEPATEPWVEAVLRNLHPGMEVRTWRLDDLPIELVDGPMATDDIATGDELRHWANVVRWWALAEHGGWWLDHDVIPLRHLDAGAWTATVSLLGPRTSAGLSMPAGHGLPVAMLERVTLRFHHSFRRPCPQVSGDAVLQQVAELFPDLGRRPLPFDARGMPDRGVIDPWAVHLWSTSSTRPHALGHPQPGDEAVERHAR